MTEPQSPPQANMPDPQKVADIMSRVAEKGQAAMQQFLERQLPQRVQDRRQPLRICNGVRSWFGLSSVGRLGGRQFTGTWHRCVTALGLFLKIGIRFAQVVNSDILLATWPGKKQEKCPITRRICWSLRSGFERTRIAGLTWKEFAGRLVFVAQGVVMLGAGTPVARDFGSVLNAITRHR